MTKLAISASLLASMLAIFVSTGGSLAGGDAHAGEGPCGPAAIATHAPSFVAEETGWRLPVSLTLHEAAAECGVVALPNAPASLRVRFGAQGGIAAVEVDSAIFGGDETDACLIKQLEAEPRFAASQGVSVKVALVEIVPGP